MTEQQKFFEALDAGEIVDCPCCGKPTKKYKHRILPSMIHNLRTLAAAGTAGCTPKELFLSIKGTSYTQRGHYAELRHWHLVERRAGGTWHITKEGLMFLRGDISVPKHVYVINGVVRGYGIETVHVNDCNIGFDLADFQDVSGAPPTAVPSSSPKAGSASKQQSPSLQ